MECWPETDKCDNLSARVGADFLRGQGTVAENVDLPIVACRGVGADVRLIPPGCDRRRHGGPCHVPEGHLVLTKSRRASVSWRGSPQLWFDSGDDE